MAMFDWNPDWETGNSTIDQEHKQLLAQMESLFVAVAEGRKKGEAERALMLIGEYVDNHFNHEEELMKQTGYPGQEEHRAIHEDLRSQVHAMVAAYLDNPDPLPAAVIDFLVNWLRDHLGHADRMLAEHLRQDAGQRPPDGVPDRAASTH